MARILLLTPQLPYPPQQGTSLRNWHIIRGLAERHEVSLLSFAEGDEAFVLEPLATLCRRVETVPAPQRTQTKRLMHLMYSSKPDLSQRLASDAFAVALKRHLQTGVYDIVQIEGLELAHLMPIIRQYSRAAIVLDCHNAETQLQRRSYATDARRLERLPASIYSRLQISRLEVYERAALLEADATVAVSELDAEVLGSLMPERLHPVIVVPNSIDVSEYSQTSSIPRPEQRFDIVFSGKMDYRPNVDAVLWFADAVWPTLRRTNPALTWGIVGQRPHASLDPLRTVPGIILTGWVDQVQPYLTAAKVVVIPLRIGSGTRLKLIEAMVSGKAVVSTTIGAEGFPVADGENLLLADSADEMAQAIMRLLDNDALRLSLGRAARTFAQAYDWRVVGPRFDDVYDLVQKN